MTKVALPAQRAADECPPPLIVVGVDGSPASIEALRWAHSRADSLGARVTAVYVYPSQAAGTALVEAASRELERAVRRALPGPAASSINTVVIPAVAVADGLLKVAAEAELLVVGAPRAAGLARVLGSATDTLLRKASCTVVVMPETAPAVA